MYVYILSSPARRLRCLDEAVRVECEKAIQHGILMLGVPPGIGSQVRHPSRGPAQG